MSRYDHVLLIGGLVDAVANLVCTDEVHKLKEIGIVLEESPAQENQTVAHALHQENGHLGLASWSLNALYVEGKKRLQVDKCDFRAASALLIAAPDYVTAWNVRKEKLKPADLPAELKFSELVLLRSPKSAESWSHRSWILRAFTFELEQIEKEFRLSWIAASRAQNNYYAGVHRLKIMSKATDLLLRAELRYSWKWLHTHVSDASGWWYLRVILQNLVETDAFSIDEELSSHSDWLKTYEHYQSVQLFQRWVRDHAQGGSSTKSAKTVTVHAST